MKTVGTVIPQPFEIEIKGDKADIMINDIDGAAEITTENGIEYEYSTYRLTVRDRPELAEDVKNRFDLWLQKAKEIDYNNAAAKVRAERDKLLAESDKVMCLDCLGLSAPEGSTFSAWLSFLKSLGNALSGEWAEYRQALRDIPEQTGFPYDVKFPEKPE